MADEQVFFRKTGEETSAFVLVWIYEEGGQVTAEASIEAPATDDGRYETLEFKGDVQTVLRDAVEYAALNGFDLRITTDGVEWPSELGSLVGSLHIGFRKPPLSGAKSTGRFGDKAHGCI